MSRAVTTLHRLNALRSRNSPSPSHQPARPGRRLPNRRLPVQQVGFFYFSELRADGGGLYAGPTRVDTARRTRQESSPRGHDRAARRQRPTRRSAARGDRHGVRHGGDGIGVVSVLARGQCSIQTLGAGTLVLTSRSPTKTCPTAFNVKPPPYRRIEAVRDRRHRRAAEKVSSLRMRMRVVERASTQWCAGSMVESMLAAPSRYETDCLARQLCRTGAARSNHYLAVAATARGV